MSRSSAVCAGPVRRREFFRAGVTGFAGLTLAGLLRGRAQAEAGTAGERTALIVVWLHGGASHLETYDPKAASPAEYRGPYAPIRTTVPGMDVCELLPRHAEIAQKFTILRSIDPEGLEFTNFSGRPVPVAAAGQPIAELIGTSA